MTRSIPKDFRKYVKTAQERGWTLEIRKGHPVLKKDGIGMVVLPSTPSDHRALKNARAMLRRLGAID